MKEEPEMIFLGFKKYVIDIVLHVKQNLLENS